MLYYDCRSTTSHWFSSFAGFKSQIRTTRERNTTLASGSKMRRVVVCFGPRLGDLAGFAVAVAGFVVYEQPFGFVAHSSFNSKYKV
jgi:hypothetical protein